MRQELTEKGSIISKVLTLKEFNDMVQASAGSLSYPIYKTIVAAMEKKYNWMGRQVAEELLDSLASSVIDRCYDMPFRVNQHVLLIWDSGWFKSSILSDFVSMMPGHYIGGIGTISDAALRGTVETNAKPGNRFVAPIALNYEFLTVREFGEGLTDDPQLKQTLLTVLEDQIVNVSLAKFAQLDDIERRKAEVDYKENFFIWETDTNFRYKTKVTIWAANYTPVEDPALLNRFNIVFPEKALDEDLRNYVMMHPGLDIKLEPGISPPFKSINEAVDAIMGTHRPPLPFAFDLREELKDIKGLQPRMHSNIIKKILAAAWWGFWYEPGDVRALARASMMAKTDSQKSFEDDVIDLLRQPGAWYTLSEVAQELGISYNSVWKVIARTGDRPYVIKRKRDPTDKRKIYLHVDEQDRIMSAGGMIAPLGTPTTAPATIILPPPALEGKKEEKEEEEEEEF